MGVLEVSFWLLVGHALSDFVFQTEPMAKHKSRHRPPEAPAGQKQVPVWQYWLSSHALVHGGAVALVLGVPFGIAEVVVHWIIDFCKCENWFGPHTDQALHILCKIFWVYLFFVIV